MGWLHFFPTALYPRRKNILMSQELNLDKNSPQVDTLSIPPWPRRVPEKSLLAVHLDAQLPPPPSALNFATLSLPPSSSGWRSRPAASCGTRSLTTSSKKFRSCSCWRNEALKWQFRKFEVTPRKSWLCEESFSKLWDERLDSFQPVIHNLAQIYAISDLKTVQQVEKNYKMTF